MLSAISKIRQLEIFLNKKIQANLVSDYRIALKLNMEINVFVLVHASGRVKYDDFKKFAAITITEVTFNDCENDGFYENIFSEETKDSKVDFGLRRRLNSIIDTNHEKGLDTPCPIITFYSYKGGMGRSTALASFAAHYAMHHNKKVVVLDCDFEAPGFTNYFDLNEDVLSRKNGVVEYLLDKQFLKDKIDIRDYLFEVSKEYSGGGEIHVMPAGNLSDSPIDPNDSNTDIHRDHYLEGLARIDISSTQEIVHQFVHLFNDIKREINPDLILIDSRTGFNDIFGLMTFHLSSIVVGFFGNNIQTTPGLHFFIDAIGSRKIPLILVNSIISSGKLFEDFSNEVNNYIEIAFSEKDETPFFEMYPIYRDPILERVGTKDEYKSDFINLIKNQSFTYYRDLFNSIIKTIANKKEIELENTTTPISVKESEVVSIVKATDQREQKRKLTPIEILSLKRKILENLRSDSPKLYAKVNDRSPSQPHQVAL